MSVSIRLAVSDDRDRIVLFNQALAKETEGRALDRSRLTDGVTKILADPALGRYFVAEKDGEIVGQLALTVEWSDWRNAEIWWIQSVYIARSHRRAGVYKLLHAYVREIAKSSRVAGLRLYAESDNEAAHAAYEALGMQKSTYVMFEEYWPGG